jgi:WD40 repeat protein/serine/threonine protein kinase
MAGGFQCVCGFRSEQPIGDPDEVAAACPACGRLIPETEQRTREFRLTKTDSQMTRDPGSEFNVAFSLDPLFALHAPTAPRAQPEPARRRRAQPVPPQIPGYEILGELGRGGMGVVYKARQSSLNRIVAIKMILAGAHATILERDRFRKEAEAVARLQHPGIVQIFAIGEHAGQPYLALEFVEGGSLANSLAGGNFWSWDQASDLIVQLARSMQYAHEQGVIHRDLKPANVLLGRSVRDDGSTPEPSLGNTPHLRGESSNPSTVKISDFGLAKRIDDGTTGLGEAGGTRSGAVLGTPSYIAPEQAAGKTDAITPAADVYSLGAILYELLTGRPPFKGDTAVETILQVINDEPIAPSRLRAKLPRDLETICLKCLQKDPNHRYPSALALAEDLTRFRNGEPIQARPVSSFMRGVKWAKRHPALSVFGFTAAAAILAVWVILSLAIVRVQEANRAKEKEAQTANDERQKAIADRKLAEESLKMVHDLGMDLEAALDDAERKAQLLELESEMTVRSLYELQLAQAATVCERDPARALEMLNNLERCPRDRRDFAWRHLRQLCVREQGKPYSGHTSPILAATASHDGRLAATADRSGQVRLWSTQTKQTVALLLGHRSGVNGIAFAPCGRLLATTSDDGAVYLWELPTALATLLREAERRMAEPGKSALPELPPMQLQPRLALPVFRHRGRCLAFASDGRTLAVGGSDAAAAGGANQPDGVARIYDLNGLEVNESLAVAAGLPLAVARYAAARTLHDGPFREVRVIRDHFRPVTSLAFSPDGRFLATGSEDQSVLLTTWAIPNSRSIAVTVAKEAIFGLAFSPDGNTLATINNDSDPFVQLWDVTARTPKERLRLAGHTRTIYALAYSADGLTIATAGSDLTVRLWDAETGQERSRLIGHKEIVRDVAFLPDRRLLSVSSDKTARIWRTTLQPNENAVLESEKPLVVSAAAVSDNGRVIVTGEPEGQVRVWLLDAQSAKPPAGTRMPAAWLPIAPIASASLGRGAVRGVAVSADGSIVAAAGDNGLLVWDTSPASGFGPISQALTAKVLIRGRAVYALALSPDGSMLASADDTGVWIWNGKTGKKLSEQPLSTERGVRELTFNSAQDRKWTVRRLALARESSVQIFDLDTGATGTIEAAHITRVNCLAFGPDSKTLATGSETGDIRIWNLTWREKAIQAVRRAQMSGHADGVTDLSFTRDGRAVISGGLDRLAIVWDPVSGQERLRFAGHTDRVIRLGLTARDAGLITIGREGTVKRWKADPALQ